VSCAQELAQQISGSHGPQHAVVLVTVTDAIKQSAGVMKITNYLEEFAVYERTVAQFQLDNPLVRIVQGKVTKVDGSSKTVHLAGPFIVDVSLCLMINEFRRRSGNSI
jgi:hypothetical protein